MESLAKVKAVLQRSGFVDKATDDRTSDRCAQLNVAVATLVMHQHFHGAAECSQLFSECLKAALSLLAKVHPKWQARSLGTVDTLVKHCPKSVFLQHVPDVIQQLQPFTKSENGTLICAACSCLDSALSRAAPLVAAASSKSAAAKIVSKIAAHATQLLDSSTSVPGRTWACVLLAGIARCMPQALKSQVLSVSSACLQLITKAAPATCLELQLAAANAAACLAACTGSPADWSGYVHSLLHQAHSSLASLPMPHRDPQLLHAARDVLGGSPGPPWSGLVLPTSEQPLSESMQVTTALLHAVMVVLCSTAPMPAPLPVSALVLLSTRLLSIRPAAALSSDADPERACQWQVCSGPLLRYGVLQFLQ
jgi:hypothetical protein